MVCFAKQESLALVSILGEVARHSKAPQATRLVLWQSSPRPQNAALFFLRTVQPVNLLPGNGYGDSSLMPCTKLARIHGFAMREITQYFLMTSTLEMAEFSPYAWRKVGVQEAEPC